MLVTETDSLKAPSQERKVKASILHGAKDLRIETKTLQPPTSLELQVSIRATGLCGSDLHYYNHYRNGDIMVKEPLTLGHESAGIVTAVGSSVTSFNVGDKVALEVGVPCDECKLCTEGRYNLCKDMRFRSSAKSFPHFQGTLQDRINHPAAWCHKLPDNIPLEMGALLEPLGVAIHATRRASMQPDGSVLVFGAGAVGMLAAAMAKIDGATNVVIADIDHGRVQFAVSNAFADYGYAVSRKRGNNIDEDLEIARETARDIAKQQRRDGSTIGEVDVVFECTGVPSCVQAAIYATRPGGKVMLIGMGTPIQTLPVSAAALREVDLCGVFRYANTYAKGISILSRSGSASPDFSKLITHRYEGLENIEQAFNTAGKTKDQNDDLVLKVMIAMNDRQPAQP